MEQIMPSNNIARVKSNFTKKVLNSPNKCSYVVMAMDAAIQNKTTDLFWKNFLLTKPSFGAENAKLNFSNLIGIEPILQPNLQNIKISLYNLLLNMVLFSFGKNMYSFIIF